MIKTFPPVLLATLILAGCHPEIPIQVRQAALLTITSQNPQCKTFKSVLKSGLTVSFQAEKSVGDETQLSIRYLDYKPSISQESDFQGVNTIEVSCTSASNQTIKSAKPFTGANANRAYEFLFSDLAP